MDASRLFRATHMPSAHLNHIQHPHQHQQHQQHQQQLVYATRPANSASGGGGGGSQFVAEPHQATHHPATTTSSRSHYSSRQQSRSKAAAQLHQRPALAAGGATSATSSDNDEHTHASSVTQLSSLSTSAGKPASQSSSQQPMLVSSSTSSSSAGATVAPPPLGPSMKRTCAIASTVRAMGGGGGGGGGGAIHAHNHRQAALQAHTLSPSSKPMASHLSASSSASSSEHTSDELHQFAMATAASSRATAANELAASTGALIAAAATSGGGGGNGANSGNRFLLGVLFTLAELLLFGTLLLWLYWTYQHDDGLAWQSDRKQQFNTHAALMLAGFIFLSGQAMLIHRSFQCCNRIYTKILHTILFVLATSAISLGLLLGYTAQENIGLNNKPIMHFYSLHAWCGLCTIALFCMQFTLGFITFLILLCCDQATASFRARLLPVHRTFGLTIFSLAIATSLMGLLQTARSRLSSKLSKVDYHELAESGVVINLIGVCLIGLAILMPYIIRNLHIKRPPIKGGRSRSAELLERHLKLSSQLDPYRQ